MWINKYYKCNNNRLIIYQDVRRNICEAEKICANDKASEELYKNRNKISEMKRRLLLW